MAKHQVGKTVSKKSRISCKGNVKKAQAIIAVAERVGNAMREAFLNISISGKSGSNKVVDAILNSAKQNAGNPRVGRGWTANLTPRTVKELTNQGVFG